MPIARTTSGLLFADDFTRADGTLGAGWTPNNSTADILTNRLRLWGADDFKVAPSVAMALLEIVSQTRVTLPTSGAGSPSWLPRYIFGATNDGYIASHRAGGITLFRRAGGAFPILGSFNEGQGAGQTVQFKYHAEPTRVRIWNAAAALRLTVNDATFQATPGGVGLRTDTGITQAVPAFVDDVVAYATNAVTVTGLTPGMVARVGTATAIANGAGTATIDLGGQMCPIAQVEVLTGALVLIEALATPVYGGDVFAYSVLVVPASWFVADADPATAWGAIDGSTAGSAGTALARPALVTHLLVPTTADIAKMPDVSGHGNHAVYAPVTLALASLRDNPPEALMGAGTATTPAFQFTPMPPNFTVHQFARSKAAVANYIAGLLVDASNPPVAQDNPILFKLLPTATHARVQEASGFAEFLAATTGGVNDATVEDSWHDLALSVAPGRMAFFLDGVLRAVTNQSLAFAFGGLALPYFSPRWVVGIGNNGPSVGVALIYAGTTLTDAEVAQNSNALRGLYGYPGFVPGGWSPADADPVTVWGVA